MTGRIQKLEDCFKEFVSLTQFREEMIGFEGRFKERLNEKLQEFESQIATQSGLVNKTKDDFQLMVQNIQSECLWRIKDAEELIRGRITAVSVDSKLKDLSLKIDRQFSEM